MNKPIAMFIPPLGGPKPEDVVAAQAVLTAYTEAIHAQNRATLITCTSQAMTGAGCGAHHAVGTLTYIQTHYYVSPHGCSGGDYWRQAEGRFRCPTCGHLNRLYASPDIVALKSYFAAVEEVHEK